MRIGLDIDDTTGCFSDLFFDYAKEFDKKLRNTGVVNPDKYWLKEIFDWSEEEVTVFIKEYIEQTAINMAPKDGASEIIKRLKDEGHTIYFISARSREFYNDPYNMTYEWFKKNDISFDKVILEATDKALICKDEGIDVFMDDVPSICKSVMNVGIKTYIFDSKFNGDYNFDFVERINNWSDFYNKINEGVDNE